MPSPNPAAEVRAPDLGASATGAPDLTRPDQTTSDKTAPDPSNLDLVGQGPVHQVIDRLDALTQHEELELEDILDAFGATAFVPVLMVLALIVVSPLSGIPFLPTFFGLTIGLVSAQMLFGRPRIWLPGFLMRRRLSGARLHGALGRLRRFAGWLDRTARNRLRLLVSPPLDLLPKTACMVCGLAMPFLELVPFSSSILGAAVILFSTGLLTRDGLFALIAYGMMGLAALVPFAVYGGVIRAAAAAVAG